MEATPELVIRLASPEDVEKIHDVFRVSIHAIGPAWYSPEQLNAWSSATTSESWLYWIHEATFWVIEQDTTIVGFVSLTNHELEHIYALPNNKRIGSALMEHCLQEAQSRKMTEIWLTSSLNAQGFYQRFGFEAVEIISKCRDSVSIPCIRMKKSFV